MSSRLLIPAAAAALLACPAAAQPAPSEAEARQEAEAAADEAVAEARAEVVAEARAELGAGETSLVTISDVREGLNVHDPRGGLVGRIESVDENGAVVSTGRARARLPFSSFGRNGRGLVISLTRAELEAEVATRNPS